MTFRDNGESAFSHFNKMILKNMGVGEPNNLTLKSEDFEILNKLAESQQSVLFIINYTKQNYEFISENCEEIINITHDYLKGGYQAVLNVIYPEDQIYVSKALGKAFEYMFEHFSVEEMKNMTYAHTYRMIDRDKNLIQILQRGSLLEVNKEKKPLTESGMLANVSHWKKTDQSLFFVKSGEKSLFLVRLPNSAEVEKIELSYAQLKVLRSLAKGNDSQTAAKELKISKYTIDTHRKHILAKTGFSDINAVIHFAVEAGIL
ncbi:LuxR C-terminal-related transcriptional regulator [Chondrinema litorale]|uniref:LuxR C-terminal-related transcriptional regulator n=1 Tax=Chondrinema litorale TaxID=2994555 RepID=UPI002543635F|nr:LuxR C-terminal-related transcriptional regulator [Chondrinema litorale]UZR92489.1 LuxR C-terminal-related transcriptional regulator [Chondrinema litorale]